MKFKSKVLLLGCKIPVYCASRFKCENTALSIKNSEIWERNLGGFPVNSGHFSTFENVGKHIAKSCV
jgi:hypothetical protein